MYLSARLLLNTPFSNAGRDGRALPSPKFHDNIVKHEFVLSNVMEWQIELSQYNRERHKEKNCNTLSLAQ